jgi:hypothetical protein
MTQTTLSRTQTREASKRHTVSYSLSPHSQAALVRSDAEAMGYEEAEEVKKRQVDYLDS